METTAKGALMDCEGCGELLADFLLDELPEAEAVLVHEHLLICPACMKAYRELKGTGKALEAVASMQPVNGTPQFRAEVRNKAQEEIDKIVARLPPERRLRLEARREARQSVRLTMSQRAPREKPSRVWSPGVLLVALLGAGVLAALLMWPRPQPTPNKPVGTLTVTMGKVTQFFAKENQAHTPVAVGKLIMPGDAYSTADQGRARIDMGDGGAVFLGPSSDLTFRVQPGDAGETVIEFDNGEAGFSRPEPSGATGRTGDWIVRTPAGQLAIAPATHAYARLTGHEQGVKPAPGGGMALELSVLSGCVHAATHDGKKTEPLYAGQRATLSLARNTLESDSLSDERPPVWRGDLISDSDLAQIFGGKTTILGRHPGHLDLEFSYSNRAQTRDWIADATGGAFQEKNGLLVPPTGLKVKHVAAFSVPIAVELKFDASSRRDTSFAFAALENASGWVVADITGREATLSVHPKDKVPRRDRTGRVTPGEADRLLLEIKPDKGGFSAQLSSPAGKTKILPLWKENAESSGEVWLQSLGEGLLLTEIKITGSVSSEWLREHVSAPQ